MNFINCMSEDVRILKSPYSVLCFYCPVDDGYAEQLDCDGILPEPRKNIMYIVPEPVFALAPERKDLVYPADTVRDDSDNVRGHLLLVGHGVQYGFFVNKSGTTCSVGQAVEGSSNDI